MIKEHHRVVVAVDFPSENLVTGDVGSVVHVYPETQAYEVEFTTLEGITAQS